MSLSAVLITVGVGFVTLLVLNWLRAAALSPAHLSKLKIVLPYLVPRDSLKVQLCLSVCLVCMLCERFLNVLIPRQVEVVANTIAAGKAPYRELLKYMALTLLHGESGFGLVSSLARIPVQQDMSGRLRSAAFDHFIRHGAEFHASTNVAEIIATIEQGDVLTDIVESLVLDVLPTVIDMCAAFVVLYARFNLSVSLYMVGASAVFVFLESTTSTWGTELRRTAAGKKREEARVMGEALQGWQTVAALNMFDYEGRRARQAVATRLVAQGNWETRNTLTRGFRQGLIPLFFLALSCLAARDGMSAGSYAFLIQYWEYIIWPIKLLSHSYRKLLSKLVDAEHFLALLHTKLSIVDKPGATTLVQGETVEFENVDFSYDAKRTTLRQVNLGARQNQTIALVGATGSGKSTLMKLLMRAHDTGGGSIAIDGHDIRDVTLASLRDIVGIVPQHPWLFNASIMDNVRYGNLAASDEDVYAACQAAAIHKDVLAFPDGYDTKAGENGAKLSGGEIQRLAIARALLKDPPILILDEATSALDAVTESRIYTELRRLRRGRLTFVVAHRLATITNATEIVVFSDGEIVERGTHPELLQKGKTYCDMWQKTVV